MYQIGIDIGGTNVKIGLLNEALELCAEISIPFPHTTAEDMAAQIRAAVGPMLQARGAALSDVESLGAVVPGSIDAAGETVVDAHNLNFHNVPLRKILSDAFPGIPVYIANDANGAALAELYTGAFVGCKTGVLLTLGTGLGGGIILNGKMFNGGMNHGVELGHAYLVDGGEPCTCGNLGCMEAYCAASALTRDGRRAMQAHPESMLAEQTGGDPGKITPKLVTDCAKAGDAAAKAVFDTYIEHLSSACASVYNILDPEVLAIGGGLSAAGASLYYLSGNTEFFWSTYQSLPAIGFNGIPVAMLASCNPIGIIFTALFMSMLDISGLQLTNLTAYNEYITNVIIAVIVYLSAFSLVIKMWIGKLGKKKDDGADANAEPAPAAASAPAGAQAETEKGGDAK